MTLAPGRALALAALLLSPLGYAQLNWVQRFPVNSPPAREAGTISYDRARQQIVLFGGCCTTGFAPLSDTWLWDGNNWTQAQPITVPPATYRQCMTYDPAHQVVVMYGGEAPNEVFKTWVWDGTNWTQKTTAHHPPFGSCFGGFAYDELHQQAILIGQGQSDTNLETWLWDGTDWTQLSPANAPLVGQTPLLAYDGAQQQLVLQSNLNNGIYNAATATWNGTDWVPSTTALGSTPLSSNPSQSAYDALHMQLVECYEFYGTQTWNGTAWHQLQTANAPELDRILASEAYDELHQQIVQFGGSADVGPNFLSNETWTFGDPFSGVTITVPVGVQFTFNGTTYTGSQTIAIAPGSYPLSVASPQLVAAGTQQVFLSWSDAGAQSHSVTIGTTTRVINGTFKVQYELTATANPPSAGNIALTSSAGSGPFFDAGTVVTATETPSSGSSFTSWTGACTTSATQCQVTMNAPATLGASFSQGTFALTINVPAGIQYTIGGFPFTGPASINLPPGTYQLGLVSPQSTGTGTQATFVSWSDGGAQSHGVSILAAPVTVTGTFKTQYLLTITANPLNGGSAFASSPPASSPYYDAGSAVIIQEAPNAGFDFEFWGGACSGSNPLCLVVMSAPMSVTAAFARSLIWVPVYPASNPAPRVFSSMAYDSARQQTVLFGGDSGFASVDQTRFSDTWVWDGTNWTLKHPAASPPPLRAHMMAFDGARQQVVLFGGTHADDSVSAETWVWDGVTWTQKHPATSPPARAAGGIAYDALHQQVVLFGGTDNTQVFGDTWVWDGTNWTQKVVAGPSARWLPSMASDGARQNIVLFGGETVLDINSQAGLMSDTWTWNGSSWTKRSPVTTPAPRHDAALAYDAVNQQVILFAGYGTNFSNQLWFWDGLNWALKNYPISPADRSFQLMSYDALRQQLVMFGGNDLASSPANDTWLYTNTLSDPPQFTLTTAGAPSNEGSAFSFNTVSETDPSYFSGSPVQVFYQANAGFEFQFFTGDCTGSLCNLTMNANKSVTANFGAPANWVELLPAAHPAAASRGSDFITPVPLVYDAARQQVVLFGGPYGAFYGNQTWVWDGANWTQKSPAHVPPARTGHGLTYDPSHQQVVMFGGTGGDNANPLGDTWVWDGNDWTQKNVAGPPARLNHGMSWDGQHVMLFGGWSGLPSFIIFGDTWVWDGSAWTQRSVPGPSPRSDFGMAYDAAHSQVVLFSGFEPGADTWIWNGAAWTQATSPFSPPAGLNTMTYDSLRQRIVLLAESVSPVQTWIWNGGFWVQNHPPNVPSARVSAGLAYDPIHDQAVLFGGIGASVLSDTWVYSTNAVPSMVTLTTSVAPAATGTISQTAGPSYVAGSQVVVTATSNPGYEFESFTGACSGFSPCTVLMDGNKSVTANFSKPFNWAVEPVPGPVPISGALTSAVYGSLAMAYDAARQQIVMFGNGFGSSQFGNQTWVWNGASWTQKSPAHVPPARAGNGLAYDPVNQVIVMFGGANSSGTPISDTWTWNGTDWTQRVVAGPPARLNHGMAWDGQHVVLFGGWNVSMLFSDTWLWDGSSWTQAAPFDRPGPRSDFGMAYDPRYGQVVLFSGYDAGAADTWIWDGNDWTPRVTTVAPPAGFNSLAYDSVSHQMVAFAEGNGSVAPQTWLWDGASWMKRTPSTVPSARLGAGFAFDDAAQQLVMFGGYISPAFTLLGDTQVWLSPTTGLTPQAPSISKDAGGNYLVTVTLLNSGNVPLASIQVNSAKLGTTSSIAFTTPASLTGIPAGATASFTAKFPPSTGLSGAMLPVNFSGVYTAGVTVGAPWTASVRSIVLP